MAIVFRCIHCGAAFAAPDALAGKRARCQACRTAVDVPFASISLARAPQAQPELTPIYAGGMQSPALVPVGSLQAMRPDDPLLELLGPRPYARSSGLSAKWIVGGGVGLACAILTFALITWAMNRGRIQFPGESIAQSPAPGGFISEPSGPRVQTNPSAGQRPQLTSDNWAPPTSGNRANPFIVETPPNSSSSRGGSNGGFGSGGSSSTFPPSSSNGSSSRDSGSPGFAPSTPIPGPALTPQSTQADGWVLQPDPPTLPLELKDAEFKIPLSGPQAQIIFPANISRFVLAWSGDNSRPEATMYDLKTGQAVGKKLSLFGLVADKALVSPDGRYVAMPRVDEGTEQHRVRVAAVSFATGEPQPRIELKCSEFHKALFAAPHQIVTAHAVGRRFASNQNHYLTLWDVQSGKSIREIDLHALDVDTGAELQFLTVSPGGKYAAYPLADEIILINLNDGQVAGRSPLGDQVRGQARLIFSPDGKLLASLEGTSFRADLRVLDMSTGKVVVDERIQTKSFGLNWHSGDLSWLPRNDGLLLDGQVMIELTTAREAWSFPRSRGESRRILRDGEMITLGADRNRYYLYSAPLPQKQIAQVFDAMRVRGGAAEDITLPPFTPTDLSVAPRIDPPTAAVAWSYVADPVGLASRDNQREFQVADEFSHVTTVRFASAAPRVVVQRLPSSGQSVIDVYDAAGKSLHTVQVPREYRLLDVSPSGKRGLIGVEHDQKWDRLDCISLEAKQHIAGWRPYGQEDDRGQDRADRVVWAAFADDDRVVTNNSQGKLACWQLPECKPLYAFQRFGSALAMSGGRKYVLGADGNNLRVFEALTGRCAGQLPIEHISMIAKGAAFRADGQEIAVSLSAGDDHVLARWSATTGNKLDEAPIRASGQVEYCSSEYLLLEGQRLFDIGGRRTVWRYLIAPGGQRVEGNPDTRTWYTVGRTENDGARQLVAFDTPSAEVKRKTARLQFEDQFLLKPGDGVRVTVDLSGVGLSDLQSEIEGLLQTAIEEKGFRPSATAGPQLSLVAIERSSGQQIAANLGSGAVNLPGAVQIDEKDMIYHLTLSDAAGRVVWGAASRVGMTPVATGNIADAAAAVRTRMLEEFRASVRRSGETVSRGLPSYIFLPAAGAETSVLAWHEERPPAQPIPDSPAGAASVTEVRPPSTFPPELSMGRSRR